MTNCPNCGAPITSPRCEYCGTMTIVNGVHELPAEHKKVICWEKRMFTAHNGIHVLLTYGTILRIKLYKLNKDLSIARTYDLSDTVSKTSFAFYGYCISLPTSVRNGTPMLVTYDIEREIGGI